MDAGVSDCDVPTMGVARLARNKMTSARDFFMNYVIHSSLIKKLV
jgi:hypothetical protein